MAARDRPVLRGVTPSGLAIAAIGFLLTRFTVTLAAGDEPTRFLLIGLGPLVVGLSVAVAGVTLAVGAFHPRYVRTVATWTVVGTASMGVLVVLSLYGHTQGAESIGMFHQEAYLSNFLIGGCVGGTLTGVYAARNERRRRAERAQAKRLAVLNHLFRDAALNAITAIRGRIDVVRGGDAATREQALDGIDERAAELEVDVEEMRRLTRGASAGATHLEPVEVVPRLEACVADARDRFPAAEIDLAPTPSSATVWATGTLEDAVGMVVESAVERHPGDAPRIEVGLERAGTTYRVTVADDGPPLPPAQRRLLADESDDAVVDPTGGFGLHVAELLVESYRGDLAATTTGSGTTVTVELAAADGSTSPDSAASTSVLDGATVRGVTADRLALVGVASAVAAVAMGLSSEAMGGSVPIIGALYGVADPFVGWVTHLFHSLVFGLIYTGALAAAPVRFDAGHLRRIAVAVGWGILLWLFAAGVIMPAWLQLVGEMATVPNLQPRSFLTHVVWGVVLGGTYSAGCAWLAARAEEEPATGGGAAAA